MFPILSYDIRQRAQRIRLLILDVDGVLTSAQLFMSSSGEILKAFNTLDGLGIRMLQESGVQTAIITARSDAAVAARAAQLGITHYFQGVHDKRQAYEQLRAAAGVDEDECAMAGDDVIDLPVMVRCGLPFAVANAHDFVKQHAAWVTQKNGGFGAVREITDLLMHAQGSLQPVLDGYVR